MGLFVGQKKNWECLRLAGMKKGCSLLAVRENYICQHYEMLKLGGHSLRSLSWWNVFGVNVCIGWTAWDGCEWPVLPKLGANEYWRATTTVRAWAIKQIIGINEPKQSWIKARLFGWKYKCRDKHGFQAS